MHRRRFIALSAGAIGLGIGGGVVAWDRLSLKRFAVVEPDRIFRAAWPNPGPLLRLIQADAIRTVVTLTAINRDDPKYVEQDRVIQQTGVRWTILPMRGSTATVEQMAEAADLIANPANQPVFFHCVGGHHRSNLVHAAYLIRYKKRTVEEAWSVVSQLSWSRPARDLADRRRIEEFALVNSQVPNGNTPDEA
jgi:protein tyrosine phosphatase (PTP) superfamily phosphohydrolase (DUF442 family)